MFGVICAAYCWVWQANGGLACKESPVFLGLRFTRRENAGWTIKLIIFVGGTCGSVHVQTFNNNLKELGVESKRNTIRRGFVHELLNAQDTVLCSYFAQRMGTRSDGWDRKGNGEEIFQGLERFE